MNPIKKINNFIGEVKQELTKVSWSGREELLGATWAVLFLTLVLAVYIGVVDFGLSSFLTKVLR